MDTWLVFTLLSCFFWTLCNFCDKLILVKYDTSPQVFATLANTTSLVPALAVYGWTSLSSLSLYQLGFGFCLGMIIGVVTLLYGMVLEKVDAPVMITLFQATPIFIIALDWLVFGTIFQWYVYVGVALIVLGSLVVALNGKFTKLENIDTKVLLAAILCCLLWAASVTAQEELTLSSRVLDVFFLIKIGEVFLAIMSLSIPSVRKSLYNYDATTICKLVAINGAVEGLNAMAFVCYLAALAYGTMTLVSTVASVQPIVSLVLVLTINKFFRDFIPDEGSHERVPIKLAAMTVVVFGVYLVS